jgi:hypothetical protein
LFPLRTMRGDGWRRSSRRRGPADTLRRVHRGLPGSIDGNPFLGFISSAGAPGLANTLLLEERVEADLLHHDSTSLYSAGLRSVPNHHRGSRLGKAARVARKGQLSRDRGGWPDRSRLEPAVERELSRSRISAGCALVGARVLPRFIICRCQDAMSGLVIGSVVIQELHGDAATGARWPMRDRAGRGDAGGCSRWPRTTAGGLGWPRSASARTPR